MQKLNYKLIEGDQQTDEWQKLREGKITGSVAKQVKGTGDAFLNQTLAIMTSKWLPKEAGGVHIDRGNDLEPVAREEYAKAEKVFVGTLSFIESDRLGYSPDGIVLKKEAKIEKITKMIEIKAPDVPGHINNILKNKVPREYIDQVIHGFVVVDDCEDIDFVSYCPAFKLKPLHIIRVSRMSYLTEIMTARIQYEKFLEKLDKSYQLLID